MQQAPEFSNAGKVKVERFCEKSVRLCRRFFCYFVSSFHLSKHMCLGMRRLV